MSDASPQGLPEDEMIPLGIRRLMTAALATGLLGLAMVSPARSETIIVKKTTYFSVGGRTAAEIDRNMARLGPVSSVTGRRHPGATQIKFKGSADFVAVGNSCRIGGAKVTLSTKLVLPRWIHRRKADSAMALIWDTLSADIKRHEERHAEIARNHARALEKAILALPAARTCDRLKARVNTISERAMAAHERDQQRFDRVEAANFQRRMIRLLKYRIAGRKP
jgi:predicted secreted Zn-dependent protease